MEETIRVLDLIEEAMHQTRPRISETHHPSRASAWLDCEECDGEGLLYGQLENGVEVEKECEACGGEGRVLEGECMRRLYLENIGTPYSNPTGPSDMWNWLIGGAIEYAIGRKMADRQMTLQQIDLHYTPEGLKREVHGYADRMWLYPDRAALLPVEIKGVKEYVAKLIYKSQKPRGDQWLQCCCYYKMLRETYPAYEIPVFPLLIFGKNNHYRTELSLRITDEVADEVFGRCVERWRELEEYLGLHGEEAHMPPAEYRHRGTKGDWSHWKCRISKKRKEDGYCPYRKLCREIEEAPCDEA